MRQKDKKTRPLNIGRRTGVDVVEGKRIRQQDDGTDVFDDYWTDSDSVHSNQTTQSIRSPDKTRNEKISKNVSIPNINAGSLRSSTKRTVKQRSEEFEGQSPDISRELSKRSDFSRKNLMNSFEDEENATFARTKMTQTSCMLNETENSTPKNMNKRSYIKKTQRNDTDISDHDINSVRRSRNVSNSSHSLYVRENLLSPRGKTSTVSISSPHEMEIREKAENKKSQGTQISHALVETESSFHKNTTFTQERSFCEETERNKDLSLGNEKNLLVEKSASKNLSKILSTPRKKDFHSKDGANAENVSLSSNMKSGKKTKDKRSLRTSIQSSHPSDETKSSPTKNTTYTRRRSHSEEPGSDTDNLSDSEKKISVRMSRVLSEFFPTPSEKDFPSTRDGTGTERVSSLSSNKKSGKKTKDKRSLRISTTSSNPSDEMKRSPTKNTTYALRRSHSEEIGSDTDNLSDKEKNSSVRGSRVMSEILSTPSKKAFPSTRDGADAEKVSLSSNMESSRKVKKLRNSRVVAESSHRSNRIEDSSSKNTTYTHERSYSKETRKNRVDSREKIELNDREKTSSVEISPRKRSSRHMANSFEVLSQKEDKSLQSTNRSEILVSGQKEKKNKQKSSMGKSPIAVKRTIQTSDILKNSLSGTPHIRNRGKESSKRNFSGGRFQFSTESSEMLNPKENIPSRSNKSVNGSEILLSHQKQNEEDVQESSVKKSPRAFQSKRMQISDDLENEQVSNNASSPVKTASPKHSAECKNEGLEVRKSSRMRFPPLASWRNERIKYAKLSSGELKCEGIDKGRAEDDYAFRYLKKKLNNKDKRFKLKTDIKKKGKNIRELIKKTSVTDVLGRTIKLNLHRPFSTCEWTLPKDEGSNPGFMLCRVFSADLMTFGFLDIAAHSMKDMRYSPSDNIYFIVIRGIVDVKIHTTFFTFTKSDTFIVPAGIAYSISNNTSRNAVLNFTSFKVPFFKYQNAE
ncbi:uncharacterized protein LOC129974987 isoform X1 [Argiope bruennichi]|uniref:uncharacterized protein LOC129974987 isoform X1 n=1 Tax=Argiope bruennichi TaxID=94029 RepID=UPI002494908D|nr:uncharacterized protein LOC129974987 isoform X1 [Argiope bruennichi]XP_055943810.1 uncharacterized protein LOC129974987 isoform X1 [Argiope bruennichi]